MMMKAEMASEMMRSRTQTINPATRTGFATCDSAAPTATDRAPAGEPSVLGSNSFSIILLHCIQKCDSRQQVVSIVSHGTPAERDARTNYGARTDRGAPDASSVGRFSADEGVRCPQNANVQLKPCTFSRSLQRLK